ncbi:hypothetical protein XM38_025800 [Halomicronema hongdechloris C2206]|uniref:Uncharacterized protein n=1 Tax=Halomicronema hongdechloris C2206 TaxID=1641165 RepID=A0A1Z3HNA6_9CYAN|nr:hypothetical protein XM38_025800 [Halomicronema hongdechloris C2206]
MRFSSVFTSSTRTVDHLAHLDNGLGIFDEVVRQLGDMNQAILMDADIHEGAEVSDVGNHPF